MFDAPIFYLYRYLAMALPALAVFALLTRYYRRRGIACPVDRLLILQVFVVYLVFVFDLTGSGTLFDIGKYSPVIRWEEVNLIPFETAINRSIYLYNVVMLMPFGFLLPVIWPRTRSLAVTTASGFALSLYIEFSQLLNIRQTDINDVMMNTLGAMLGYACYTLVRRWRRPDREGDAVGLKNEHMLYLAAMAVGHFFLYNWRALSEALYW